MEGARGVAEQGKQTDHGGGGRLLSTEERREEVARVMVPHFQERIGRACGGSTRIPIDIRWDSFLARARRPEVALAALHLWGSYFVLYRIASVIEELCSATSASASSPSQTDVPLYPNCSAIVASRLMRIVIQNEDKELRGRDKVVLQPFRRKRPMTVQLDRAGHDPQDGEDEDENDKVWVLTLRGNFSQGTLGGFSRKRLLKTLARKFGLAGAHHRVLLQFAILPQRNAELARILNTCEDAQTEAEAFVQIDWNSISEDEDERALRNLAGWGGHYSIAQIILAFRQLTTFTKSPKRESWKDIVRRVVVQHHPGQDATRKRCFVEDGTLYVVGVWEIDGWHGAFHHQQIVEVSEISVR